MKGDFSRILSEPDKQYTGVMMQQGRVQLDSDWNSQVLLENRLRQELTTDIIGLCGMPADNPGFGVRVRQGLRFDGKDDFVYCGKDTDLSFKGSKGFTMETFIKPEAHSNAGVICGRFINFDTQDLPEYVLHINKDNTLSFIWLEHLAEFDYEQIDVFESEILWVYREINIHAVSMSFRELRTLRPMTLGIFSHVAVTMNPGSVKIYINGDQAAASRTGNFAAPGEGIFLTGAGWFKKRLHHVFNGVINDLTLWNNHLTQDRVRKNMNTLLTGNEPGVLRLWRFNQENEEKHQIKDWSVNNKACVLGAGRPENFPQWEPQSLLISKGRCYNHGIASVNPAETLFSRQPSDPGMDPTVLSNGMYLFYLETWERYISSLQDPEIRESALGGPDTTGRRQTVWQVKYLPEHDAEAYSIALESRGLMQARHDASKTITENRLYRVEIHHPGMLPGAPLSQAFFPQMPVKSIDLNSKTLTLHHWQGMPTDWNRGRPVELCGIDKEGKTYRTSARIVTADPAILQVTLDNLPHETQSVKGLRLRPTATFKWSRDNGTTVFPIAHEGGSTFVLEDPDGLAQRLRVGAWMEISDDRCVLQGKIISLLQIKKIERAPTNEIIVTVDQLPVYQVDMNAHPLARLWDQSGIDAGLIPLQPNQWLDLEEGIAVCFNGGGVYHHGDYWWIPARVDKQLTEWPVTDEDKPLSTPPSGIDRFIAPLALVEIEKGLAAVRADLRQFFEPIIRHHR